MTISEAYSILNANQNDSIDDIRKKYFKLAKENHPDVSSTENEKRMIEINNAWDLIRNIEKQKSNTPFNYEKQESPKEDNVLKAIKEELIKKVNINFYDLDDAIAVKNMDSNMYYQIKTFLSDKQINFINNINLSSSKHQLDNISNLINAFIFDFCLNENIIINDIMDKVRTYRKIVGNQNAFDSSEYISLINELRTIDVDGLKFKELNSRIDDILNEYTKYQGLSKNVITLIKYIEKEFDNFVNNAKNIEYKNIINGFRDRIIDKVIENNGADFDALKERVDEFIFDIATKFKIKPLNISEKYALFILLDELNLDYNEYQRIYVNIKYAKGKIELEEIKKNLNNIKERVNIRKNKIIEELKQLINSINYNDILEDIVFDYHIDPSNINIESNIKLNNIINKKLDEYDQYINSVSDINKLNKIDSYDLYLNIINDVKNEFIMSNHYTKSI